METKISMIAAVSEALLFRKQNPNASYDDTVQHISNIAMREKETSKKMGMIAAASRAIEYKERNPQATEKEIINYIMKESTNIVNNFDFK
jgi:hypothetical protein